MPDIARILTRIVHQVSLFTSKVVLYSKYQFIDVDGLASMMFIDLLSVGLIVSHIGCTYGGFLAFPGDLLGSPGYSSPGEAAEQALRAAAKQMSRKVLVALAGSSALPLLHFATSLTITSEHIGMYRPYQYILNISDFDSAIHI